MEEIFDTDDKFNFDKLLLSKPVSIPGGNFFIHFSVNNFHLYIQPPQCKTKQGIIKSGKRIYSDLMFTNENGQFIRWMENLENHCQKYILKNKSEWFEGDLDIHDIENYFTSPMKVYKSGKYYTIRTNISTILGKPSLKIYEENENLVELETVNDNMNIMTILEVQGIKCSARSFQIEIELKQMMILKPSNIFEKCIIKPKLLETSSDNGFANTEVDTTSEDAQIESVTGVDKLISTVNDSNQELEKEKELEIELPLKQKQETITESDSFVTTAAPSYLEDSFTVDCVTTESSRAPSLSASQLRRPSETYPEIVNTKLPTNDYEMEEVTFDLAELPDSETVQIKQRNDVYYEMYREARRKAKIARDLALSSYLEAKRIKNTYMLDDIKDSDESDLETDE